MSQLRKESSGIVTTDMAWQVAMAHREDAERQARVVTDEMVERGAREMTTWSGPVPGDVPGFRPYAERLLRAALETPAEVWRCEYCGRFYSERTAKAHARCQQEQDRKDAEGMWPSA